MIHGVGGHADLAPTVRRLNDVFMQVQWVLGGFLRSGGITEQIASTFRWSNGRLATAVIMVVRASARKLTTSLAINLIYDRVALSTTRSKSRACGVATRSASVSSAQPESCSNSANSG